MSRPLPEPYERTTWRIDAADMDLLRLLFPHKVNEVARGVIRLYCQRLRERGLADRIPVDGPTISSAQAAPSPSPSTLDKPRPPV